VSSLKGRIIAITRSRNESEHFLQLVEKEGGKVIPIKAIEVVPEGRKAVERFLKLLNEKKHDYCAFMSAQAVLVLFRLGARAQVLSTLSSTEVIAIGPKTKQELENRGVRVDLMPDTFSTIGLVKMFSNERQTGKRIIIPRSGEAGDYASKELTNIGMDVDEVFLYRVRTAKVTPALKRVYKMILEKKVDAIVFTSASNARSFMEIIESLDNNIKFDGVKIVSIGPFTSAELRKRGLDYYEARNHTIDGTVEAVKELFTNHSR
jgi:uroporphyrinogen-III synthase